MVNQSEKKKRLDLDVIGQLEDSLEVNSLDYGKWNKLINLVVAKDKEEQVRKTFEKYLSIFKYDSQKWCNYINYELNRGEFEKVVNLFQRCFLIMQSVDLCRLYVSYVRRTNDVVTGGERARGTVIQAFEFAVSKVGIDTTSSVLWNDYLEFLKSWTPAASWEQQQKVDLIRKVYKKYLVIPTEDIETSWSQYTKWENEVNASTASKFISEKSSEFMLARSWNTEWNNVTKGKVMRSIVPAGVGNPSTQEQLKLWNKWLELEEKNHLQIKDENILRQRIEYVYRSCTIALVFVPEVWFKFSRFWLQENEEANLNKSTDLLNDSLILNPKSLLLSFQLAELYEKDNNFEKSKKVYEDLAQPLIADYVKASEKIESINDNVKKVYESKAKDAAEDDDREENDDNDEDNHYPMDAPVLQFSDEEVKEINGAEEKKSQLLMSITLVYSKLMIASKRAQSIKEARAIFKQARQTFKDIGHEFYVQSALMEHYSDNKKTAIKIFDLALKFFATNGYFLSSYLDFLINNNDVDNARKLIQTSAANITKEVIQLEETINTPAFSSNFKDFKIKDINDKKSSLKTLYKRYIDYALNYISLDVANSFAIKYQQTFPEDDPIDLFSDRYKIGNVNLINKVDLGIDDSEEFNEEEKRLFKRRKLTSENTSASENEQISSIQANENDSSNILSLQNTQNPQEQSFVRNGIYSLLRILPNASYFGSSSDHAFDSQKLVELFSNLPGVPVD